MIPGWCIRCGSLIVDNNGEVSLNSIHPTAEKCVEALAARVKELESHNGGHTYTFDDGVRT